MLIKKCKNSILDNKSNSSLAYLLMVIIGGVTMLLYINSAVLDVPAINDYIREINNFVGEGEIKKYIFSTEFFLQPPMKLLANWINYNVFNMSVKMDMFLGTLGLTLTVAVFGKYCINYGINSGFYLILCVFCFSLSKWEMLINGTGWEHFWAFFLISAHFLCIDKWYRLGEKRKGIFKLLIILPIINILGIAVFYGAVYSVVVTGIYVCIIITRKKSSKIKNELTFIASVDIPMIVYVICSLLNNDTRIVSNGGFIENFFENPIYFIEFFVMSFSSEIVGVETVDKYIQNQNVVFFIGILGLILYIFCISMNLIKKIYIKTLMPLILLLSGFLNHCIVLFSRWGFNNVSYGMSSRYELQYMFGGIGIILTIYFYIRSKQETDQETVKHYCAYIVIAILLCGNVLTTVDEINKAPYRKAYYEETKKIILCYDIYSDEELEARFGIGGEDVRQAISTLKEKRLNVWGNIPSCIKKDNTLYGRYDDGWLAKEAGFVICSGKKGNVEFDCYNPNPVNENETITIKIENQAKDYPLQEGQFTISIPCRKDEILYINVYTDFSVKDNGDIRERSFILNNIYGK